MTLSDLSSIIRSCHIRVQVGNSTLLAGLCLASILVSSVTSVQAENGKTILVLDASGSMWQEIADGYKIHIAQDVINDLLKTLPADQELGLMTYGHRRTGDCGDIELLVPPGVGTRGAIATSIEAIDPKGKTPLSAAVIQAADSLRIEENAATVILISDGRETCNLDPCAVGSELEDRGIDFTTHVIGFDINVEKDREQLRCLAENTGGKFLTASTASELTEALVEVSQPVQALELLAYAKDEEGTSIQEGLVWSLIPTSSANDRSSDSVMSLIPADDQSAEFLKIEIDAGDYTISVTREEDGASASLDIGLQQGQLNRHFLTLPVVQRSATISGPASVVIGQSFEVEWEGPALSGDLITLAHPDAEARIGLETKILDNGNTVVLQAPSEPGEYELRYLHVSKDSVLATAQLIVENAPATIQAVNSAPQATSIPIIWTGPDHKFDTVAVAKPGEANIINDTPTSDGSPLELQMPLDLGNYELRYVLNKDGKILATQPIIIVDAEVSIESQDIAGVGIRIPVIWTGPDEEFDYIAIAERGSDELINLTRTSQGSPLELEMPTSPGEFELRYISNKFDAVLSTRPISVNETSVTLDAVDEASVGESVSVNWEGPDEQYDVIGVGRIGESSLVNKVYTEKGSPLKVQMPTQPGEYELRYILYQDKTALSSRLINVVAATVSLDAVDEASVGESVSVTWEGPDEQYDIIGVGKVGESTLINSVYIENDSPLMVQMPTQPGEYELRYILYQGKTVLSSRPITVVAAAVSLDAVDEAGVGETVAVTWEGPDEKYDVIGVGKVGESSLISSVVIENGSPSNLRMPDEPGDYEIRYILHQGKTILATRQISIVGTSSD